MRQTGGRFPGTQLSPVMHNAALRTATACTQDTNIQHLHDETLTLPIHENPLLHVSQCKQKTQHPSHPLHKHTTYFNTPLLSTLSSTTAATQNSHKPPHSHYNRYKNAIYTLIYFPASPVAPFSNSEQINHPFSNHTFKVDAKSHPSPLCLLCNTHNTPHLFN